MPIVSRKQRFRRRRLHKSAKPIDLLPSAIKREAGQLAIAEFESFPRFPMFHPMAAAGTIGGMPAGVLFVPGARTAKGRTIRYHEAMHLNLPHRERRENIPDLCYQAIEDLRIHVQVWPENQSMLSRDALTTALRDLRRLERVGPMELTYEPHQRNAYIVTAARSLGIYFTTANHSPRLAKNSPVARRNSIALKRIDLALGMPFVSLAGKVYGLVRQGHLEGAEDLLAKLFAEIVETEPPPRPAYDPPTKPEAATDDLDAMADRMKIVELDRSVRTQAPRSQRWQVLSSSGLRINAKRLAPAVVENTTKRLFKRKIREIGGTVVIDGSGSMALSNEALADLCKTAPAATVAYYYGEGDTVKSYGRLVIYAKGGRRYDGALASRSGGNDVDYWAVRWMLRGTGPRILVSDGAFCGGPSQQAGAAMQMLTEAIARGDCEWVRTVEDAREKFRELA